MNLLDNRPLIIGMILTLISIKFVLVPVIQWQNQTLVKITKQDRQLQKGLALVDNKDDLLEKFTSLKNYSRQQLKLVASDEKSPIAYQLKVQKNIESLLDKYKLKSRSVTWLAPVRKSSIEEHRLEVTLSGKLKEFIQFMVEIEKQKPKLALMEFRSNISKMKPVRNELGQFTGKFIVVGWRSTTGEVDE